MRVIRLTAITLALIVGAVASALAQVETPEAPAAAAVAADEYTSTIQPIFDGRCVACHSCNNAPCQLNLQGYAGFERGANKLNVYDAARRHSVKPTRLGIDGKTEADWRAKSFFPVNTGPEPGRNLLLRALQVRASFPVHQPAVAAADAQVCVAKPEELGRPGEENQSLGMPYGLPPLSAAEMATLTAWIGKGAPGQTQHASTRSDATRAEAATWEAFLNDGKDARQPLVSRYLYEHLFLAHLYFPAAPREFYRLVRSRTPCGEDIDEIATRRPNDDPGVAFQYCLRRLEGTIVEKTHMPYELTPAKLERVKSLFLGPDWTVGAPHKYSTEEAKNPFATFAAIPVRARYQFLLDDAHYEIATFIKGPVCNGSSAVNSIQEQFYVFFLSPDADGTVVSAQHMKAVTDLLILPGEWGSDVPLVEGVAYLGRLVEHRETYRRLRAQQASKMRPKGYALADVWDGDGTNPNAVLTVFRHFDNAAVVKGAAGDTPKTVMMLDYPLFERLVYNLVVNFDVYGNVGHQSLTRLYMDLIRMEGEEMFLSFLPPRSRDIYRGDWYRGGALTEAKLKLLFPLLNQKLPTAVKFRNAKGFKTELIQRILFERMTATVRGRPDPINWRDLQIPDDSRREATLSPVEAALRRIASVRAVKTTPFARHMPDIALLVVRGGSEGRTVYSLIHNREHENVSWVSGEEQRLAPDQDTLTVMKGYLGAYPNMLFAIDAGDGGAFADAVTELRSGKDYAALVARFGVPRTDAERFWPTWDEITADYKKADAIGAGTLDLTRYDLAKP